MNEKEKTTPVRPEKPVTTKPERQVMVTHLGKTKRGINLGRQSYVFRGRQTLPIPQHLLKGSDWESVKNYFRQQGVK